MPNSPILNLPQVAPGQADKETTINTATAILEAASNASLVVSLAGGNVELTPDQFTKYVMFRLTGHSVARTLYTPDSKRLFVVSNEGSDEVSVQPDGSASGQVLVPAGKITLMMTDGDTIRAVSSGVSLLTDLSDVDLTGSSTTPSNGDVLQYQGGFWVPGQFASTTFLGLSDTPANYTSAAGKLVRVNPGATGLIFSTADTTLLSDFPAYNVTKAGQILAVSVDGLSLEYISGEAAGVVYMSTIADVDIPTSIADGDVLAYNEAGNVYEFRSPGAFGLNELTDVDIPSPGPEEGSSLVYEGGVWTAGEAALNDAPSDDLAYLRQNAAWVPRKVGAHRYWRVYITATDDALYSTIGEINILDEAGEPILGGTATASTEDGANTADKARDGNNATFWRTDSGFEEPCWWAIDFGTVKTVSAVTLTPAPTVLEEMPLQFNLQYSDNGSDYVTWLGFEPEWGDYDPQTFETPIVQYRPKVRVEDLVDVDIPSSLADGDVLKWDAGSSTFVFEPAGAGEILVEVEDLQTESFTLSLTEKAWIPCDPQTGDIVITIPKNAVVAFPIGTSRTFSFSPVEGAADAVMLEPVDGDVSFIHAPDVIPQLRTLGSVLSITKIGTNTWQVYGDLATAP